MFLKIWINEYYNEYYFKGLIVFVYDEVSIKYGDVDN